VCTKLRPSGSILTALISSIVPKSIPTLLEADFGGMTIPNRGAEDSKQRLSINRYLLIYCSGLVKDAQLIDNKNSLPWFEEVQIHWDAREGELASE
jgi:hypothetical protein